MHEVSEEVQQDSIFLGEVKGNNTGWHSDIKLNGEVVSFKLDTGAAVTAIPTRLYSSNSRDGPLLSTNKKLYGPSNNILPVVGHLVIQLESKDKSAIQPVFVTDSLARPLLGLPAIEALQLIERVSELEDPGEVFKKKFPKVFSGQGRPERGCCSLCPYYPPPCAYPFIGQSKGRVGEDGRPLGRCLK